jgi:hypothetical protein
VHQVLRNSSGTLAIFAAIRRAADRAAVADVAGVADETALSAELRPAFLV